MFTREETKLMRLEIEVALQAITKKYGYNVSVGGMNFGTDINAKIKIAKVSSNEHGEFTMTKEAQTFLNRIEGLGLAKDCLNETYDFKGKTYKITGYNTRARRYPITFIVNEGKHSEGRVKTSVEYMKDIIKANRPEFFL